MNGAEIMAKTFFHTCTIKRVEKYKDGAFTRERLTAVYTDIPCAVSHGTGSNQGTGEEYQRIEYSDLLFTRPEVEVRAGDVIEAKIYGKIETFEAGHGFWYPTHRQTPIKAKGRA